MQEARIGVIGGSGLYDIPGMADVDRLTIDTPFGPPSDEVVLGNLAGVRMAFLPRHGRGHRISPSELPSQANIWAMKMLGVTHLISISAVGSLREEMAPRDVVVPNQLLDRTKGVRPASFFGDGLVVHISFAEPYCLDLSQIVYDAAVQAGARVHRGGTMVVMEGPQFSTKAEAHFYRQIGGDLIGMTALPEAKLAREAEICYCTLAMVTDYDCWHESEEVVTTDMVVANLLANVDTAKAILRTAAPRIRDAERTCACGSALASAIITRPEAVTRETRDRLSLLVAKYLP